LDFLAVYDRCVRRLLDKMRRIAESILEERGPLIRGAFVEQHRTCGRANCRCARGERHRATVLTRSEAGKTHTYYVPVAERVRVQARSQAYQRLRRHRAQLAARMRELLSEVDALQQALTEPYPHPGPHPRQQRGKATRRRGER